MATGTVVVVGGTQGLGRELAQSYADEGRDVVVTGRDQARAETAAGEIGGSTRGIGFDLADPHLIAERLADVGDVGYLVLAAIERDTNNVREYDIDAALRLVDAQARRLHRGDPCAALRGSATDPAILIYGGLARDRPYPGSTTVTTVNGAVTSLVRTLVIELAPTRVNALHPAIVGDSPQWRRHAAGAPRRADRSHADRASRDDGRGRRRVALPARERGDQRHQPRRRRRLDLHVS